MAHDDVHDVVILERRPRLPRHGKVSQTSDHVTCRGSGSAEAEVVPWEAGPVAERVFEGEVGGPIGVRENEVGGNEGVDRGVPLDVMVVVNEKRYCGCGKGFGSAASVEECFGRDGLVWDGGEAEAFGVG